MQKYIHWTLLLFGLAGALLLSVACSGGSNPAPVHPQTVSAPATPAPSTPIDLSDPALKEIAMELVSTAENSTKNWKGQYGYIEDIRDGRGYTAGIIGFTSGTSDMLKLIRDYTRDKPHNILAQYIPALVAIDVGHQPASHQGLDPVPGHDWNLVRDWKKSATDPDFQKAQDNLRDSMYFHPAVAQAKQDGLGPLGQFIYYDAYVNHGPGSDQVKCDAIPAGQELASLSFPGIRQIAMCRAKTPSQGGDEIKYLNAFLDVRKARIQAENPTNKASRVEDMQRVFLRNGKLHLERPLRWRTYTDPYMIP